MYWPIGVPNVYALKKHAIPASILSRTHDGASDITNGASVTNTGTASVGQNNRAPSRASGEARQSAQDAQEQLSDLPQLEDSEILDVKISRGGSVFVTITRSSILVWQTKPTVALAGVVRSSQSLNAYGQNTALLLRPDALIIVVQTTLGYLVTYSLATDPSAQVYLPVLPDAGKHVRRPSTDGYSNFRRASAVNTIVGPGEGDGIREVNVRFRMVIRIDAGVSKALALEEELVVATKKPSALQCIRWVAENGSSQTSTELVSRMSWVGHKATVLDMVHDRPMNLLTWVTSDGRAYAVQRRDRNQTDLENPKSLFQGFCFRDPEHASTAATMTAVNARFSLIAVGCVSGEIDVYVVKDYTGNIPLSHHLRLPVGLSTTGKLMCLSYSPDGYCLFAGYEHGWATWSVYGTPCGNTFGVDRGRWSVHEEQWLRGARHVFWAGQGCELAILPPSDNRLYFLDIARNAMTGCFCSANISRGLLQTTNSVILYRGHDVSDVTSLSSDMPLWQTIQIPPSYLVAQWPIKIAVTSADSKYIAVAGRRGLAHYSVASGRWKTFDDPKAEQEFTVRGGMCWFQHILIATVEANNRFEVRLYSRNKALDHSNIQHVEKLSAPAISTTVSGTDSLLVYTYDNTLLHYVMMLSGSSAKLIQVGQIGFQGIIRAPPRVRAISWILPEDQLEHGDPSQDVATASVLFLVDGKLVLLQPSTNDLGQLKYDMRVLAQNVEFYVLLRDQPSTIGASDEDLSGFPIGSLSHLTLDEHFGHGLRDSLWYFDGTGFHVWSDIHDVLARAPVELGRELPPAVAIPLDFSPLSIVVAKGIVSGIEPDLVQRRDVNFSFFRHAPRTQLFLPQLLRYHLAEFNSPAALHLSSSYQNLPYFSHALEVLLHDVLDLEVDHPPSPPEMALLPTVLSFLSSFGSYLDVIVNCTRKTELRSWKTLFSYLPPVRELFHQTLTQGRLNTAAGYLLVLHAFEEDSFQVHECSQLLDRAASKHDWELCRELARFLVGIDPSGAILSSALAQAGLGGVANNSVGSLKDTFAAREQLGREKTGGSEDGPAPNPILESSEPRLYQSNGRSAPEVDYFSIARSNSPENIEAQRLGNSNG